MLIDVTQVDDTDQQTKFSWERIRVDSHTQILTSCSATSASTVSLLSGFWISSDPETDQKHSCIICRYDYLDTSGKDVNQSQEIAIPTIIIELFYSCGITNTMTNLYSHPSANRWLAQYDRCHESLDIPNAMPYLLSCSQSHSSCGHGWASSQAPFPTIYEPVELGILPTHMNRQETC